MTLGKCYVSVQVTYLLDNNISIIISSSDGNGSNINNKNLSLAYTHYNTD